MDFSATSWTLGSGGVSAPKTDAVLGPLQGAAKNEAAMRIKLWEAVGVPYFLFLSTTSIFFCARERHSFARAASCQVRRNDVASVKALLRAVAAASPEHAGHTADGTDTSMPKATETTPGSGSVCWLASAFLSLSPNESKISGARKCVSCGGLEVLPCPALPCPARAVPVPVSALAIRAVQCSEV